MQFTEEERADPLMKKSIKKVEKRTKKADQAQAKIPKKIVKKKERITDSKTGKEVVRLHFEEVEKKPPSKLSHAVKRAPKKVIVSTTHQQIQREEENNVGVESAHKLEEMGESTARVVRSANRSLKLRPYKKARVAERKLEKANIKALYKRHLRENPNLASNPMSRFQQKRAIKKQYAKARVEHMRKDGNRATKSAKAMVKKSKEVLEHTVKSLFIHKKIVLIIGVLVLVVVVLMNCLSSCAVMLNGGTSSVAATTYLSEDEDMLAAEKTYAKKETDLQDELNQYEELHSGYDEYRYELDTISHNPYVLISILSALFQEFRIDEVQDTLTMLFERQYILTEEVTVEVRYREEQVETLDENGVLQIETVEVPYEYSICTVKLENRNLSHIPAEIMGEEQLSMYAAYMATLGNRPDLFPRDQYPNVESSEEYTDYEIPPAALEDATFSAMIQEAEKYLGFPYVWGGANPSTSFDCSGFVSWVINHSGWNVGRRTAQGLFDICTPVGTNNAKPGDLIFFKGTYKTNGVSHVGIYVGDGMMIHCGDPISYASINTNYWQKHFYSFGRLP